MTAPRFGWVGTGTVAVKLEKAAAQYRQAAACAVYGQALALHEIINREGFVPLRTGRLRLSAYVTQPDPSQSRLQSQVGYAAPYAPEVHERPGSRYSKWMEKGVTLWASDLAGRLAKSLRAAFQQGTQLSSLAGIAPQYPRDPGEGLTDRGAAQFGYGMGAKRKLWRAKSEGTLLLVDKARTARGQKLAKKARRRRYVATKLRRGYTRSKPRPKRLRGQRRR